MRLLARRRQQRLNELSEAEAYARCHGERGQEVRVVRMERRRPRYETTISGEELRQRFEERLDAREPEHGPPPGNGSERDAGRERQPSARGAGE